MIEILQPFEVRAGNTTTVNKHVGGNDDSTLGELGLGGISGGTVGSFEDSLAVKRVNISVMDGLLSSSRDETITFLRHEREGVL